MKRAYRADRDEGDATDILEMRELIEGEAARRSTLNLDQIEPVIDALSAMEELDDDVGWAEYLKMRFAFTVR